MGYISYKIEPFFVRIVGLEQNEIVVFFIALGQKSERINKQHG